MFSAFQSNAFQNNAFQIARPAPDTGPELLGGKAYPGVHSGHKYAFHIPYSSRQEEIKQRRDELIEVETKISEAEIQKQEYLSAVQIEEKNRKILFSLESEINVLANRRAQLIRLIDDEESILVLLLSLPFKS